MTRTKSRWPVAIEPLSVAEPDRMTASPVTKLCGVAKRMTSRTGSTPGAPVRSAESIWPLAKVLPKAR